MVLCPLRPVARRRAPRDRGPQRARRACALVVRRREQVAKFFGLEFFSLLTLEFSPLNSSHKNSALHGLHCGVFFYTIKSVIGESCLRLWFWADSQLD